MAISNGFSCGFNDSIGMQSGNGRGKMSEIKIKRGTAKVGRDSLNCYFLH